MRKKASTQMNCIETINMPRIINKFNGHISHWCCQYGGLKCFMLLMQSCLLSFATASPLATWHKHHHLPDEKSKVSPSDKQVGFCRISTEALWNNLNEAGEHKTILSPYSTSSSHEGIKFVRGESASSSFHLGLLSLVLVSSFSQAIFFLPQLTFKWGNI